MEVKQELFETLLKTELAIRALKGGGAASLPLLNAERWVLQDVVNKCHLMEEYEKFRSADKRWKK